MKTNRKAYFLDRDEYDIMLTIREQIKGVGTYCPIRAVSGKGRKCIIKEIIASQYPVRDCETCIQNFLNEEYKE